MRTKLAVSVATVALGWLVCGVGIAGATGTSGATSSSYNYSASAYGTYAAVGSVVKSGATAPVGTGCGTGPGFSRTRSVASVDASPLLGTGVINDSAATGATSSTASSDIVAAQVLGGAVSASEIKAVSTTTAGSGGNTYSAAGSHFVGLKVGGLPISGSPAPNTTIPLPGVGSVVLNQQVRSATSLTVNMIHVYVTVAQVGIPANTNIIVGHAVSGLGKRTTAILSGGAYGAQAVAGTLLHLGAQWPVTVCGSTNGHDKTNAGAAVNLPSVLGTGTVSDTVNASGVAGSVSGRSTSTVQSVSLLGGLVSANAIEAAANVSQDGSAITTSDVGSSFVDLVVNGQSIPASVPANTQIKVGAITVWLHRVIKTSNGIDVRALEIVVHGSNPFGLPFGADIQVARAYMSVFPVA